MSDPHHRTLRCQTCSFECNKEADGLRVFGQHVCKDHKEEKPSKSEMRQGGATSKRKKCSTCGVKVKHNERHQDPQGNYLCRFCATTALAKKRGTKPPTSGGAAGGAGAAAGGSDPVSTQCVPTTEQVELTKQLIKEVGGRRYSKANPP